MVFKGFLASLLGLAVVQPAVAAPPAKPAARPATCIWAATTENTRNVMLARAPSLEAILAPITGDQAAGLAVTCGLPATTPSMVIVGQVLRARTLMAWAADQLTSKYNVDPTALDAQWPSLAAVTKQAFAKAFTPAFKPSDAAYDGLDVLRDTLKLSGDDASIALFDYAAGRAVIEGLDGG